MCRAWPSSVGSAPCAKRPRAADSERRQRQPQSSGALGASRLRRRSARGDDEKPNTRGLLFLRASARVSARPKRGRRSRAAAAARARTPSRHGAVRRRRRRRLPRRALHTVKNRGASARGAQKPGGDAAPRRVQHARTMGWDVVYDAFRRHKRRAAQLRHTAVRARRAGPGEDARAYWQRSATRSAKVCYG